MSKMIKFLLTVMIIILPLVAQAKLEKESVGSILEMMVQQGQITSEQAADAKKEMMKMDQKQWDELHQKAQTVIDNDDRLKQLQNSKGIKFTGNADQVDLIKDAVKKK